MVPGACLHPQAVAFGFIQIIYALWHRAAQRINSIILIDVLLIILKPFEEARFVFLQRTVKNNARIAPDLTDRPGSPRAIQPKSADRPTGVLSQGHPKANAKVHACLMMCGVRVERVIAAFLKGR